MGDLPQSQRPIAWIRVMNHAMEPDCGGFVHVEARVRVTFGNMTTDEAKGCGEHMEACAREWLAGRADVVQADKDWTRPVAGVGEMA